MRMPTQEWESVREWAARNEWEMPRARQMALNSLMVDYVPTIDGGFVRHQPHSPVLPKYVKISKSDLP